MNTTELINLYHLANTALAGERNCPSTYSRMKWAAGEYAKIHGIPAIRAYKALCTALDR